jgi:nucleoid DNA-binding protein
MPPRKTKTAVAVAADSPAAVPAPPPAERAKADALKLRDLVAQVAAATGDKPAAVKRAVEATVAAIGAALQDGRGLNLPGLGKAKIAKGGDGKPLTIKLRVTSEKIGVKPALADGDD